MVVRVDYLMSNMPTNVGAGLVPVRIAEWQLKVRLPSNLIVLCTVRAWTSPAPTVLFRVLGLQDLNLLREVCCGFVIDQFYATALLDVFQRQALFAELFFVAGNIGVDRDLVRFGLVCNLVFDLDQVFIRKDVDDYRCRTGLFVNSRRPVGHISGTIGALRKSSRTGRDDEKKKTNARENLEFHKAPQFFGIISTEKIAQADLN